MIFPIRRSLGCECRRGRAIEIERAATEFTMLIGATNFRDLGGLPVAGGRRVRHGRIYRSNSLARLTDDDVSAIEGLGLRTVVDLRTEAERSRGPARGKWDSVNILTSEKRDTADMLASLIGAGDSDETGFRERFSSFYARIPELYADEYGAMFRALAAGETPLLINCSAGKDRTGVAVMLIMVALEVDRDAAIVDYMLSGARLLEDPGFTDMLSVATAEGFGRLSPHARAVMLGVDRAHIEAALEAVTRDYGSAPGYLMDRLGLTADALGAMRHHLTEQAPTG